MNVLSSSDPDVDMATFTGSTPTGRPIMAAASETDGPFGGFKQSGIGREMVKAGLEEFLEGKTFATVCSQ